MTTPSPPVDLLRKPKPTSTVMPLTSTPPSSHSQNKRSMKAGKFFQRFRYMFNSFSVATPSCKMPVSFLDNHRIYGGTRMTGTLFGFRKGHMNLAIQESPKHLPMFLLEFAIPTTNLQEMMTTGLVRIVLECEKHPTKKIKLMDEPTWTMYCNGRKLGYSVKRELTEDDLKIMKLLHAVSMGAGVLPIERTDGELVYMRSYFERVIGSKDSETYYMMNPDGNNSTELSIFFIRV